MKAGRELDAMIAEKVMGWKPFKKRWQSGIHNGTIDAWLDSNDVEIQSELPHYSTSIAAAWEVVEKLKSLLKGELSLSCVSDEWTVYRDWHTDSEPLAWADTSPLAICLAALKAVGENK